MTTTMDKTITVNPFYIDAKNEITKPGHFVGTSQYFVDHWMPKLGPTGTCIVLFLRRRGYLNIHTGERRDRFVVSQKEMAEACQCSVATLRREFANNEALKAFVTVEEQFERNARGQVRQRENVYLIAMDDPLAPEDLPRLETLIKEREAQARTRQAGRKVIHTAVQALEKQEESLLAHFERVGDVVAQNERVGDPSLVAHFGTPPLQNERPYNAARARESIPLDTKKYNNNTDAGPPKPLPDPNEDVVVALCNCGVSRKVAEELCQNHPKDILLAQIAMLPHRDPQNPAAVLVKAIRDAWAPPATYVSAQEEQEAVRRRREAERRRSQERADKDAAENALQQQVDTYWSRLSCEDQAHLEAEAERQLRQTNTFLAARLDKNPQSLPVQAALAALRKKAIRTRLGLPLDAD